VCRERSGETTVVKRAFLALAALALLATPTHAQEVTARTLVEPNPIAPNQPFVVTLELRNTQRLDADPPPPELGGFARFVRRSTSSQIQIVNGRTSAVTRVEYHFVATREGTFTVPALEVASGGVSVTTEPVEVTVDADAPAGAGAQSEPAVDPDDLFVDAVADETRVYENEPVTVEYRIYARVDVASYGVASAPTTEGFWVEEAPAPDEPRVEQVTRNGSVYATALVRRIVLFPTGPGRRTVGPMTIDARVRVRRRQSLFDDVFGGSRLFGEVVPTVVASSPVEIEVLPLPEAGRPRGFDGLVGSFDVTARLDRSEVEVNEAVTLSVEVSGEGNLRSLSPPELDLPADFEVFDPEISDDLAVRGGTLRGSRTFEWVLVPRAPGAREIPAIALSFFQPELEGYARTTSDALPLTVTGESPSRPGSGTRRTVESLRRDIRFIRLGDPSLQPRGRTLADQALFWLILLLPPAALGCAATLRRYRDRLEGDVAWARRRRAGRTARTRLTEASEVAARGGPDGSRDFYAAVDRAVRGFLGDALNVAEAGLMTADVPGALDAKGVDEETTSGVVELLETCDRGRFAPAPPDRRERERVLERAEHVIAELEAKL